MIKIYPFKALMPPSEAAQFVASEPYDVIDTEEARERAQGNDRSFLHVVRSEIDFPVGTDPYGPEIYRKAADNLEALIRNRNLIEQESEGIYIYRQVYEGREQYGVVCCYDVEHYRSGEIKKHEKTRPVKEDDRTRHMTTSSAHAEPVFLAFNDDERIEQLLRQDASREPFIDFVANDGVSHTIWPVADPAAYVAAFAELDRLYIADGHHRTAASERAAAQRQADNPDHRGDEEYNRILAVLFPAGQLKILPYNRVVVDLHGLSRDQFLDRLRSAGTVEATSDPQPPSPGSVCVYAGEGWYRLTFDPAQIDTDDPIQSLDVALLQNIVLTPILGVGDPRTDHRIDFVGGIRGTQELERLVDSGRMAVAFSMYPTSMQQLIRVSDAGMIMPPKSTWFEPKLRSGLFVHRIEPVE